MCGCRGQAGEAVALLLNVDLRVAGVREVVELGTEERRSSRGAPRPPSPGASLRRYRGAD